jgi:hypothetical protein
VAATNALDVINGALRILQTSSPDANMSAHEANAGLEALNLMIDSWSNESMMLYHIKQVSDTLTAGVQSYLIGNSVGATKFITTGNIMSVESATAQISTGADFVVQQMAFDDWASIRLKALTTSVIDYFYIDKTTATATTLNVYPVPSVTIPMTLYVKEAFSQFPSLTSSFNFPPGYGRAMKLQLACELAPEYQTSVGNDVIAMLMSAKAAIKKTNKRSITSQIDIALTGVGRGFNIYKGR